MTNIKTTVRNRRIDVAAPSHIPDGTEIMLTIAPNGDSDSMPPDEVSRVLAAMQELERWEIPQEVADDLDAWERRINHHGIEHPDPSMEDVFP